MDLNNEAVNAWRQADWGRRTTEFQRAWRRRDDQARAELPERLIKARLNAHKRASLLTNKQLSLFINNKGE